MRKLLCLKKKIWLRGGFFAGFLLSCLSLSLLNYNKVEAISVTTDATPTGKNWTIGTDLRCTYMDNGTPKVVNGSVYGECNIPEVTPIRMTSLRNIYKNSPIDIKEGYYYTTYLQYSTTEGYESVLWNLNTTSDFNIVSFKEVVNPGDYPNSGNVNLIGWSTVVYEVVLQAKATKTTQFVLGNFTGQPQSLSVGWKGQYSMSGIYEYKTTDVGQAIEDQTQAEQDRWDQENNKAEDAINSEQDTGAKGSDEQAKGNLNLFKTILETPAGSCNLPEISAFGFSLGELNLCTYQPPNWIKQIMGAVITIVLAGASIKCTVRVLETLGHAYGGTK